MPVTHISKKSLKQLYYEKGLTQREIADLLGCSKSTVSNRMQAYGLETRTRNDYYRVEISYKELHKLYLEQELGIAEIAARLDCNPSTIRTRLQGYGIPLRPPGGQPKEYVPPQVYASWTPSLAYAVGLFAADGWLIKGSSEVCFPSTDQEMIKFYRACLQLGPEVPVYRRQRPGCKTCYEIKFSDRGFRSFLEEIGLTPAKSKNKALGALAIPQVVFRDFVRGCWDGDGDWTIDQRGWHSRTYEGLGYLRAQLTCTSYTFLRWMQETIEQQTKLEGSIVAKVRLRYYGPKAVALGHWLYYAPDLPALSRKREIWQPFAEIS